MEVDQRICIHRVCKIEFSLQSGHKLSFNAVATFLHGRVVYIRD